MSLRGVDERQLSEDHLLINDLRTRVIALNVPQTPLSPEPMASAMNMIDRVALAMKATGLDCAGWHEDVLKELAVAAIKAMREPTEMMEEAASITRSTFRTDTAEDIWRSMIEAALVNSSKEA